MKRMKKAVLLPVRSMAYQLKRMKLYYWSEKKLYELRVVCVMPRCYYRWLYHICIRLVAFKKCRRLADRTIHTIPYHVRFEVA